LRCQRQRRQPACSTIIDLCALEPGIAPNPLTGAAWLDVPATANITNNAAKPGKKTLRDMNTLSDITDGEPIKAAPIAT